MKIIKNKTNGQIKTCLGLGVKINVMNNINFLL